MYMNKVASSFNCSVEDLEVGVLNRIQGKQDALVIRNGALCRTRGQGIILFSKLGGYTMGLCPVYNPCKCSILHSSFLSHGQQ